MDANPRGMIKDVARREWLRPSWARALAPVVVVVPTAMCAWRAMPAAAQATRGPHAVEMRSEQSLSALFNQGIARVPDGWILSGTNSPVPLTDVLTLVDEQLQPTAVQPAPIPPEWRAQGYAHIGDIDVVGNVLYVPFEQPTYALGRQAMAWYDATTLAFLGAIEIAQHENSFVTVDPVTHIAYSMDRFDGNSLFRYDVADGWRRLSPPLLLNETLVHTQGADVVGDAIWISTSNPDNDIYRVPLATGVVERVGRFGHPGGEGEGIDATSMASGVLHGLVIAPDHTQVYLEHFGYIRQPVAIKPGSPPGGPGTDAPAGRPDGAMPATGSPSWPGVAGLAGVLLALGGWRARRLPAAPHPARR